MTGNSKKILLTGATGYIGSQLLKRLQKSHYPVRCLVRSKNKISEGGSTEFEIVEADLLQRTSLSKAMEEMDTAYYLVHSMSSAAGDFESRDRRAAQNFAGAAAAAGLKRIIYLGGLGKEESASSPHLRSRHEVGRILRSSGIPTVEFRSSIVIGPGSFSFEMIRALVERLPVMITPRWVSTPTQPIYIEDLLDYLVEALKLPLGDSRIIEIGGADVVTYGGMMREYSRQRGLHRVMIPVPVLTPHLSSLWLGLVTPHYTRIGRVLVESIRTATTVQSDSAEKLFQVKPRGLRQAVRDALDSEERELNSKPFSEILATPGVDFSWGAVRYGNRLVDSRTVSVHASPEQAFRPIAQIGGAQGWYYADWLWKLRGWLDQLVGGVGLRRGRPNPDSLKEGDTLDFWRVEVFDPPKRMRLRAEMKLPGRAWLEFEIIPDGGQSTIRQTAMYDPKGLSGLAYWFLVYPLHEHVFAGMLREIARLSQADQSH
jgi:uncharacterized protein YbjT (DUF2867 family)